MKIPDSKLFYAHAALFAFSEIIFILSLPIYLYKQGFSLPFIFLFHGLIGLSGYFFTTPVIGLILKRGIKPVLTAGVLLYVVFGLMAPSLGMSYPGWLLALVVLSLQSLLYFPARHLFFVEIADKNTVGLQTGVLNSVGIIARIIAPIVAGLISLFAPFTMVLYFGALVMVLSLLPIVFIQTKVQSHFDPADFFIEQKTHSVFTTTRLPYLADGMNNVLSYLIWPLFFFLLLGNQSFFKLGTLMTITSAISVMLMIPAGHLFDRSHRKKLLSASIGIQFLASLFRFSLLLFHPATFVYAAQSLYAFSESALQSTFDSYLYSYGKVTNTAFFTIHREMYFSLGRFVLCALLAVLTFFVRDTHELWYVFLLSIPILFLYTKKMKADHFIEKA